MQTFETRTNSVQKQIVKIDFSNQILASVVPQNPQRSAGSRAACLIESIQWRGQRTYIISPRSQHIPYHVYPHGAKTGQRNVGVHVAKLTPQYPLHPLLPVL